MVWTEEMMGRLRAMWLEGVPAGVIAREIGATSRNAVMGKVHRMGLMGSQDHNSRMVAKVKGACRPIFARPSCPVRGTIARVRALGSSGQATGAKVALSLTMDLTAGTYDASRVAHKASLVSISTILARGDPRRILVPTMSEPAVLGVMRSLAMSGVVVGGKTPERWNDEENGDVAFFEDMLKVESAAFA